MAAPLYYDADHPLLSDDAAALTPEARQAQAIVAEKVLGIAGTDDTIDDDDEIAQLGCAVALQINYQVSLPPEAWAISVDKTGPLETDYRGVMPEVFPPAEIIADAVLEANDLLDGGASGWPFMGPRR